MYCMFSLKSIGDVTCDLFYIFDISAPAKFAHDAPKFQHFPVEFRRFGTFRLVLDLHDSWEVQQRPECSSEHGEGWQDPGISFTVCLEHRSWRWCSLVQPTKGVWISFRPPSSVSFRNYHLCNFDRFSTSAHFLKWHLCVIFLVKNKLMSKLPDNGMCAFF
jgi:hypothetical protein